MKREQAYHGRMGRRQLLSCAGALAVGGVLLTACDMSDEPAEGEPTAGPAGKGSEAPTLAQLVEQGQLPAVTERLPENPLLVEAAERVGRYGGTWNTAILGPADDTWLNRTVAYEEVNRWTPDGSLSVVPNVAESVDQSADGREFTLSLDPPTDFLGVVPN